jgi:hypothetical protein
MTCPLPENVWLPFTTVSLVPALTPVLELFGLPVRGFGAVVVGVRFFVAAGDLLGDALGVADADGGLGIAEVLKPGTGAWTADIGLPDVAVWAAPLEQPATAKRAAALRTAAIGARLNVRIN